MDIKSLKHLKTFELHSSTYYSAAEKWKKRKPDAKEFISKFRKRGNRAKQIELKELWDSYPKNKMGDILKGYQQKMNNVYKDEPDYIMTNSDYKCTVENNTSAITMIVELDLDVDYDVSVQLIYMDMDQDTIILDNNIYHYDEIVGIGYSQSTNLKKITCKKLVRFINQVFYENEISLDLWNGGTQLNVRDLNWWDIWNGKD